MLPRSSKYSTLSLFLRVVSLQKICDETPKAAENDKNSSTGIECLVLKLLSTHWIKLKSQNSAIISFLLDHCKDRIYAQAARILNEEVGEKWKGWTYEQIRSTIYIDGYHNVLSGFLAVYFYLSINQRNFTSSARIPIIVELAKHDLQKGSTIPEIVFSCCRYCPKKDALQKLIELGKESETANETAKSVLEFENHQGFTCMQSLFHLANISAKVDKNLGSMLSDVEESCEYLIDLAKFHNLDSTKYLNHTSKNGWTLFFQASKYSESITKRLLEENVHVNSVSDFFQTPEFEVSFLKIPLIQQFYFSFSLKLKK